MFNIQLYGTLGCHLCDDAEAWLQHYFPMLVFTKVDIACDEELVKKFGIRIPVLMCGDMCVDWPFTEEGVKALVSNAQLKELQEISVDQTTANPARARRVLR